MELLERTFNDKKVILKNALKTHFNSIKKGLNGIFVFMLWRFYNKEQYFLQSTGSLVSYVFPIQTPHFEVMGARSQVISYIKMLKAIKNYV